MHMPIFCGLSEKSSRGTQSETVQGMNRLLRQMLVSSQLVLINLFISYTLAMKSLDLFQLPLGHPFQFQRWPHFRVTQVELMKFH